MLLARAARARIVTADLRARAHVLVHRRMMMVVVAVRPMHVAVVAMIMVVIAVRSVDVLHSGGLADGILGHEAVIRKLEW